MSEQLPSLVEFVILFQDQHMICTIDTPKVESTIKLLTDAISNWHLKKENYVVAINGITGPCYVATPFIFGFYLRPAHEKTINDFQKKILELTERQVKAAENIVKEHGRGEDWRGDSNV